MSATPHNNAPEPNLHRNNAAERVMIAALVPLRLAYLLVVWIKRKVTR